MKKFRNKKSNIPFGIRKFDMRDVEISEDLKVESHGNLS